MPDTYFVIGYQPNPMPGDSLTTARTYESVSLDLPNNEVEERFLVEAGDILESIEIYAKAATNGVSGTITAAPYVADESTNLSGEIVGTKSTFTTSSSTSQWHLQSVELDLTPWAGQYIKPNGGYSAGSGVRLHYGTVTIGDARSVDADCPSPLASTSTRLNAPLVRMTIRRPEGATYQITSVNDDDELNSGSVNTAEVVGYDAGVNPIVSGTVGSLAVTDVSQAGTEVTFTIPDPVDASYWPEPDATATLTLTDGTNPATFDALFNSIPGYTSVVIASPDNDNEYKLGYWATFPFENGDRVMFELPNPEPPDSTIGWTINADGSYTDAPDGVKVWYHWRIATSLIYIYEATVGGGVVVDNRGLSVVGLSVTGLSVSGLSVTGL